jgi:lipoate-protein ligase B
VELQYISLGQVSYQPALDIQQALRQERITGHRPDTLLLLEHSPVLTLGRRAREEDILVDTEALRSRGVDIVRIDRGGEVTYHGPGQLVGYLIFHLSITGGSIKRFVYLLEESLIRTLREFGIEADRNPLHRGVWIGQEKIAALGLSVSRQVTMHGFALNVHPDLSHFRWIIPCGIRDAGVTSMERVLKRSITAEEVRPVVLQAIADTFGFSSIRESPAPVIQSTTQEEVHR